MFTTEWAVLLVLYTRQMKTFILVAIIISLIAFSAF